MAMTNAEWSAFTAGLAKPVELFGFEAWKEKVDVAISAGMAKYGMGGLTSSDLTDQPYERWFQEGWSPAKAAKKAIANEKKGLVG